jgi:hypothetical protein
MSITRIIKSKYAIFIILIVAIFCWIGVGWQYLMVIEESSQKSPEPESMLVYMYYYNENKAEEIGDPCSPEAVIPVERRILASPRPIRDTIRLLIQREITDEEKEKGFSTEFPHPDFNLLSTALKDRVLFLEFTEVPGFTSGGSCRVGLLKVQIEKTAKQFLTVGEVSIEPEYLFQP